MGLTRILIANRGEIAVRVSRTIADLGLRSVAVFSPEDEDSGHRRRADESRQLEGSGVAAYLDGEQIVEIALESGCDAIHPGYGFLSENADFATLCRDRGLIFVGPRPEILELFGDKSRARALAQEAGVSIIDGTAGEATLDEARTLLAGLGDEGAVMLKAVAGGGGRGVRVVRDASILDEAWERASSEALKGFGNAALYVERYLDRVRHIEVQVAGDGSTIGIFGERDCSLQRRHQKLIELAPAPGISAGLRSRLHDAARRLASSVDYDNLGTFEFLVDAADPDDDRFFAFIEANARLQVEHTVTEQVWRIDLVRLQLLLAGGQSLAEALGRDPVSSGSAVQARVNMETLAADGSVRPTGGTLKVFELPSGPGVRVDSFATTGYTTNPQFDSLLAKIVVEDAGNDLPRLLNRLDRALSETRVEGLATNTSFLRALVRHPTVVAGDLHTSLVDDLWAELVVAAAKLQAVGTAAATDTAEGAGRRLAGAVVDSHDPLAVLAFGQSATDGSSASAVAEATEPGAVVSPLQGTVLSIEVEVGGSVAAGDLLVVMESMKMEHEIRAGHAGVVARLIAAVGDTVWQDQALLILDEGEGAQRAESVEDEIDLDEIRPDLQEIVDRKAKTLDASRPESVARRRAKNQRTARENVEDLVDPGTFLEYGGLTIAAQRRRRTLEDLIDNTPADGMITGIGTINGALFDAPASRCAVLSYDYTVLAGTQGTQNHRKTDRLLDVAEGERLPLVLFSEGGGGRPGDTDKGVGGPGDTTTFAHFAKLSGLVPLVGINSGRCFAGNASLLGCCDVIIATADSNIGMGGPAMIEGGGLGVFRPEDIGPMSVQVPNGVVDLAVADEAEAVVTAKRYLGYFQGRTREWQEHDARRMRRLVPENRLRVYDVRAVIETLADIDSVLELRVAFGVGMITSLVRVEGRPLGIVANNPVHLGGAIDSDGADKGARFLQLCDAFDIPVLFLCDTPGIMVGPEAEKTALVRHANRMFLIGANLSVPYMTVVLRKAYGLGALAMKGGSNKAPIFTVGWPTAEFGGMGLEGSVKLGYRKELAAIDDADLRRQRFEEMVAEAYEIGKGLNQASQFAIDDVIDPAETRAWVAGILDSVRRPAGRDGKKRPAIDGW